MRVATRRQRAAWRVFGAAFRGGRTKRYRARPARDRRAARRGPRPRRPARGGRRATAPTCRSPSSARSSRCSPTGATHRDDARRAAGPRARLGRLPALGRRLPRLRPARGRSRSCRSRRPQPHRVRDTAGVADLDRVRAASAATSRSCAGPTSRRSTSCGSPASGCATRSSSCARRSAPRPTPLIARVTALQDHLGLLNDANVTAPDGPLLPGRARRRR